MPGARSWVNKTMRKDTPIGTQLPEWKKEVAEKVKAYGERKKRLTTPPYPLKENKMSSNQQEIPVKQPSISLVQEDPEPFKTKPAPAPKSNLDEKKPGPFALHDPVAPPAPEIWPEDIQELTRLEKLNLQESEETGTADDAHLSGRLGAGLIDHTILILITAGILFGFSIFLNQSMQWLIFSAWKGSLSLFVLLHFIYHLYFYRSSRQTPGMLFVSLELRDPVLSSIPMSKLIFRWLFFVLLNVLNFIPLLLGKQFLLLDRLSGTEIRSFH